MNFKQYTIIFANRIYEFLVQNINGIIINLSMMSTYQNELVFKIYLSLKFNQLFLQTILLSDTSKFTEVKMLLIDFFVDEDSQQLAY